MSEQYLSSYVTSILFGQKTAYKKVIPDGFAFRILSALRGKMANRLTLTGLRQGIYYGTKVRFVHALVTVFLFRNAAVSEKFRNSNEISAHLLSFPAGLRAC